jgi:hypothetical protein
VKDPRVRKDGRCAHCSGKRKLAGLKRLYRASAEADPFCSATCCRDWYIIQREKESAA